MTANYENLFPGFDQFPTIKEVAKSPSSISWPSIDGNCESANLVIKSSPTKLKSQTAKCFPKVPSVVSMNNSSVKSNKFRIGTFSPVVK